MPETKDWANALDLGLVGDGETDNSEALEKAFKKNKHIYKYSTYKACGTGN